MYLSIKFIMELSTVTLPIVEQDEWLKPVADKIYERHNRFQNRINAIIQSTKLTNFANYSAEWKISSADATVR